MVSNDNVATFIKELVLEPEPGSPLLEYQPGDYLQFDIPAYDEISFDEIAVNAPFAEIWKAQGVFDFQPTNALPIRRNFSMATDPGVDEQLRFNVRVSTPPPGQDCSAGAGSTYLHRLKPGDKVTAIGPFGTFHIKPTEREMVYLGGGSGMAPLRSHLAHLFETEKTGRRISFWYGARSLRESFYRDYFEKLGRAIPQLQLPPRAVRASARGQLAVLHRLHPRGLAGKLSRRAPRSHRHRILSLRPAGHDPSRA